ncbi:MAG: hypothetical protein HY873_11925 [Chloroflexi bacterium]|nr:hypothetical protein [Chloroflexota bacterium]
MGTYVSMLNWSGEPQPAPSDVRIAVKRRADQLHTRGMHSLAFLPDEGACAAVMVCSAPDDDSVAELAYSILPHAILRIETMRFDDDSSGESHGLGEVVFPPPPRDYLGEPLDRIVAA